MELLEALCVSGFCTTTDINTVNVVVRWHNPSQQTFAVAFFDTLNNETEKHFGYDLDEEGCINHVCQDWEPMLDSEPDFSDDFPMELEYDDWHAGVMYPEDNDIF